MTRSHGNDYTAVLPANTLAPGLYEYAVSTRTGTRLTTFPGAEPSQPSEWPFHTDALWSFRLTPPDTPLRLLDPKKDFAQLSFVRPGEQYRTPFFQIVPGETADESALRLGLPDLGVDTPERYAASLYVGDIIAARRADAPHAQAITVKLRGLGGTPKTLQITLIEQDGAAWTATVDASNDWSTVVIPLRDLRPSRSILIPTPYPGLWNYWRAAPMHRGDPGDHIRPQDIERLQLTVTPDSGHPATENARGVAIESIRLAFAAAQ